MLFLVCVLDDACDRFISFVGQDAFSVVIQCFFGGFNRGVDLLRSVFTEVRLLFCQTILFKELDCRKAIVADKRRNLGERLFNRFREGTDVRHFFARGGGEHRVGRFFDAFSFEGRDADDRTAERPCERLLVDLVAVLFDGVHHVQRHDDRDADLKEL